MSSHPSPWSDPATETQPGVPYAGPPPTTPYRPAPGWPPPAPYGTAWPPVWPQPWPPAPARPQRPGQVIAAAVLAFVQAAGVALASAYLQLLGSVFSMAADEPGFPADGAALAADAGVLSLVQLVSVVLLVAAGVLALTSRRAPVRWTLAAAFALQLALAAYWVARLLGAFGSASGLLLFLVVCFAAGPAVALGLSVGRPARAWFTSSPDGGTTPHR
ncbi:hypothetical protein Gobs01_03507 [Geodermatophilus obscurus DSM 43160]|uniref:Uncharacterized protein n=1 Tax=Geodermatophilus obscurus (strain ATCC 25078 / DSM 43160 / JCM 3152 / CCUG 61914 / KCC A-0152 / KCTC 9177 / NBRC 13315 / NRRL B-3577 / G-20) TaxID=526225 RepID=D2SA12_GEOOG|nr:hypothetical protein Gobs_3222 [Geodermatophilus obscurus DSM 43160]